MKVKIIIIGLVLSVGVIYYILSAPHRVERIQSVFSTTSSNTKEEVKPTNITEVDAPNKIKAQYNGVVIEMTKSTITVKNTHDNSISEYSNFEKINPMVKVERTVKQGFTLGRAIEN